MHVYEQLKNGTIKARHETKNASKGGKRPTTVRDVRKWREQGKTIGASTTTYIGVMDKGPFLTRWFVDKHLETAFEQPPMVDISFDEWKRDIRALTEPKLSEAADKGTEVHAALEAYMLGGEPPREYYQLCKNAEAELLKQCGDLDWECEVMVFSDSGFANTLDLVGRDKDTGEIKWIVDYKNKAEAAKFKKNKSMIYDSHPMQLAANRESLKCNARCANLFVCSENDDVWFYEHPEEELERGWKMFKACMTLYNLKNRLE